ncbi:MAG: host specificity protein [Planctomycetaceae bacterium]|nr:host specificity protein [Planctomycetaceae bacterium]
MVRRFKEILANNELCRVFQCGRIYAPPIIDLFALAGGYHGFWFDQEHCGLTYKEVESAALAARANGLDCIVRMAPTGYSQATQNLEAGVGGLMAARIESAAHAEEFVSWVKFAPRGSRGMNTSGRDANFTHLAQLEFAEKANREHFVAIQIETLGALRDIDAITANDAVDLVFVGPADLSQALGIQGQRNHAKVWEALEEVAKACKKYGKHWGIVPVDAAFADRCYDLGCRMITFGNDINVFKAGITATKQAYASRFA